MKAKELLSDAIDIHGSLKAVARFTGLHTSALKRIKNGTTTKCHPQTLGLLVKATQAEGGNALTAGKAPATQPQPER